MSDPRFQIVRSLLDFKADPDTLDKFGRTMFHSAAINCDLGMIDLLLEYKADINLRNIGGFTPIHYAIHMPSIVSVINKIIQSEYDISDIKAHINILNSDGLAPLHIAVNTPEHTFEAVEFMLDHKANVNILTSNGMTPLQLVDHNINISKLLIAAKANI